MAIDPRKGQRFKRKYKRKFAMYARRGIGENGYVLRNINDLACTCNVSRSTILRWANEYEDFKDAFEIFQTILANRIQNLILDACEGKLKNPNIQALIFAAKNQSEWKDSQQIDYSETRVCKLDAYED